MDDRCSRFVSAGATVIKKLHDGLSVGAEAFRETTNRTNDDTIQSGFNVGMIRDLGENHGILMSLGRSFGGRNLLSFYGAYELRFGRDGRPNGATSPGTVVK